jgi:hypothetical protein
MVPGRDDLQSSGDGLQFFDRFAGKSLVLFVGNDRKDLLLLFGVGAERFLLPPLLPA